MSTNPRFIVAKYAPCLSRMEPRNIGVFLWCNGEIRAKFRSPAPEFVKCPETYKRWIRHWKLFIKQEPMRDLRGQVIDRKSPDCMDALLKIQDGNYILVDAGFITDNIDKKEIDDAIAFLFKELVSVRNGAKNQ